MGTKTSAGTKLKGRSITNLHVRLPYDILYILSLRLATDTISESSWSLASLVVSAEFRVRMNSGLQRAACWIQVRFQDCIN